MVNSNRRPPGRPKTAQTDQPMDHVILRTALQLFLNKGYQKVSIDDISKACGVTKATVYYYFNSKSILFTQAMIQMMERIRTKVLKMLQAEKPLKERLYNVAEAHLRATASFDMESYMRETKTTLSSDQIEQIKSAEDKMYQAISEAIQTAIDQGEIKSISPVFAAHAYVSLLNTGRYQFKDGHYLFSSTTEAAQQIVNFFWDGLSHSS